MWVRLDAKKSRRIGVGHGGSGLAGDVAGFADAVGDHTTATVKHQFEGVDEFLTDLTKRPWQRIGCVTQEDLTKQDEFQA